MAVYMYNIYVCASQKSWGGGGGARAPCAPLVPTPMIEGAKFSIETQELDYTKSIS